MTAQRSEWRHTPLHEAASDRSRLQNRTVKRASSLVEKLEVVEEFVSQKYYEAPPGRDEQEADAMSQLEEVVNSLRLLS
jgi:hypothetical protein